MMDPSRTDADGETNTMDDADLLTENVGIFVRKLIGQNKKISLVQKRSIARQIEHYIRSKINPEDFALDNNQTSKHSAMHGKLRSIVDKMESYTKIARFGPEAAEKNTSKLEISNDKKDFDELLDNLTEGVDKLLLVVNNKIKRLMTELELCGEVLGCRKWGYRDEESHSLHGMIIKEQMDHAAKVNALSEERDMLKIFVQEHQLNLENVEMQNREMAAQIQSHIVEIEQLRHQSQCIENFEKEVKEVTNQLRESERRCHVLESQLTQLKPTSKVTSNSPTQKRKSYANITALYCNRPGPLTPQSISNSGSGSKKVPATKAQFLSHLK